MKFLLTFSLTLAILFSAHPTRGSILHPVGLSNGDFFRLAFVTSTQTNAVNASVPNFNEYVEDVARGAGSIVSNVDTTWTAIVSSDVIDARLNTSTDPSPIGSNGVPIFLVDGETRIANDYDDLWDGTLLSPLQISELGTDTTGTVWTGSSPDGTASGFFPLGGSPVRSGITIEATDRWVAFGSAVSSTETQHIYGLSGVLQVLEVPEPSVLFLVPVGIVTIFSIYPRCQRHSTKT